MTLGAKIVQFNALGRMDNVTFSGGEMDMDMVAFDRCAFRAVDLSGLTNCEFLMCHFSSCTLSEVQDKGIRFVDCHIVGSKNRHIAGFLENCHVVG